MWMRSEVFLFFSLENVNELREWYFSLFHNFFFLFLLFLRSEWDISFRWFGPCMRPTSSVSHTAFLLFGSVCSSQQFHFILSHHSFWLSYTCELLWPACDRFSFFHSLFFLFNIFPWKNKQTFENIQNKKKGEIEEEKWRRNEKLFKSSQTHSKAVRK